ncbi:MAG: S8 family serine peptidase [Limisphaerales bacterium]
MRLRSTFWILLGLLLLAGAWLFWPSGQRNAMQKQTIARPDFAATRPASTAPPLFAAGKNATNTTAASARTNRFAWRLSNTTKTIGQLTGDPHAILLENALIDSSASLNLAIPKNLQAQGDPGAYIVQARGPVDNAFRSRLAAAGAQIVSYIPNNAYLVTISAGGAAGLAGQPGVQSVIPYEPYYKLPESLMPWVGKTFPADRQLRVAAYPGTADQLRTELVKSGAQILAEDTSPFGRTFIIENVTDVAALVRQGIVQRAEPAFRRMAANDLSRVTMGISSDTITSSNYMDLSGKNVLVEVNDSGIDSTHPDFTLAGTADAGPSGPARVTGAFASSLFDTNGHGTFVAGIIAGNGSRSKIPFPVGSVAQGSVTNADFRGKAPLASLYSVGFLDVNGNAFDIADSFLQAAPALTNALISNNSWNYVGDNTYNLAAASYDAAVRDALPLVTGSQPVQFVFPGGQ